MKKDILTTLLVILLFLFICIDSVFSQNEAGVDGLIIGSEQDNTYSALVIRGASRPLAEESKRDILFKFKDAGMSAIRAYRSGWYGTYLQFLTSQDTAMVSLRPRMHIDCLGRVGIGTVNPLNELDVNGSIRSNGDLQLGEDGVIGNWGSRLWFNHKNDNTDPVFISRYNVAPDVSELRINIGDWAEGRDKFSIGYTGIDTSIFTSVFTVQLDGKVGIKTDHPQNELDVNGTIRAKEVKVESEWADFVFKKDYNLPTLEEVEQHIEENGTLPGVPSEKEVKANGVNLAETNVLLLQKIEELILYIIQQEKRMEVMEAKIDSMMKVD